MDDKRTMHCFSRACDSHRGIGELCRHLEIVLRSIEFCEQEEMSPDGSQYRSNILRIDINTCPLAIHASP